MQCSEPPPSSRPPLGLKNAVLIGFLAFRTLGTSSVVTPINFVIVVERVWSGKCGSKTGQAWPPSLHTVGRHQVDSEENSDAFDLAGRSPPRNQPEPRRDFKTPDKNISHTLKHTTTSLEASVPAVSPSYFNACIRQGVTQPGRLFHASLPHPASWPRLLSRSRPWFVTRAEQGRGPPTRPSANVDDVLDFYLARVQWNSIDDKYMHMLSLCAFWPRTMRTRSGTPSACGPIALGEEHEFGTCLLLVLGVIGYELTVNFAVLLWSQSRQGNRPLDWMLPEDALVQESIISPHPDDSQTSILTKMPSQELPSGANLFKEYWSAYLTDSELESAHAPPRRNMTGSVILTKTLDVCQLSTYLDILISHPVRKGEEWGLLDMSKFAYGHGLSTAYHHPSSLLAMYYDVSS
ncbi:hypothetical protein B0H66DRAFT_534799 [Apodospora peruviana]|uniref:Uncharacterized protein n=1 Tax=Apodospora peruviana TaxID=516989 RepID=A0AAE0I140_9PEZI|nr:hypothetical protein B0H66DRAFT_534799 [Apodospora peruviana]